MSIQQNEFVYSGPISKDIRLDQISGLCHIDHKDIIEIYPYGSRVYGTHTIYSDYDFIVIYDGDYDKDGQQYVTRDKRISAHTHSQSKWNEHLNSHKIFAMECNNLPSNYKKYPVVLNKQQLRIEISSKSSNSWVKCKKKLEVENDYQTGIKSLFHSFRIPMFGIQIAKYGKIEDYSIANHLWFDSFRHMLNGTPWSEIKEQYQPEHNKLMTQFRLAVQ